MHLTSKLLKVNHIWINLCPELHGPRHRHEGSHQEIRAVGKSAAVCVPVGCFGVKRKNKKGYEGERRDKGK